MYFYCTSLTTSVLGSCPHYATCLIPATSWSGNSRGEGSFAHSHRLWEYLHLYMVQGHDVIRKRLAGSGFLRPELHFPQECHHRTEFAPFTFAQKCFAPLHCHFKEFVGYFLASMFFCCFCQLAFNATGYIGNSCGDHVTFQHRENGSI